MENNIDKEKIFLDNMGNRMKLAKENGCKLLDCKTIDNNIKLRLENIKLKSELSTCKKIVEKMADYINELVPFSNPRALPLMIVDDEYKTSYRTRKNTIEVFEYLARKEVEKDD